MKFKFKKNFKKYMKYVSIAFVILAIVNVFINGAYNSSYAAINSKVKADTSQNLLSSFLGKLGSFTLGALFVPVSQLINIILFLIVQLVSYIFGSISGGNVSVNNFPFADRLIYNELPIFDPNFFNPSTGSVAVMIKTVIAKFYYSMFIIAGAIFVISAMIMGIKLALTTIASEKAEYKEALTGWLMGLVLLFSVHFLMAGIFAINEKIVEIASVVGNAQNVTFSWNNLDAWPVVGKFFSSVVKIFNPSGALGTSSAPGYQGLLLKYFWQALGGDIVSSIIGAILIFQAITLIIMYIKRLFYCFLLSLVAPAIIAADIIKKSSTAQKKSLFANWLQHFSIIVFTQSFQAILLTFILMLLSNIQSAVGNSQEGLVAIMSIICTSALITSEKTIKQLFGISDSFLVDAKSTAMKTMMGIGAVGSLAHTAAEPFKDRKNAKRNLAQGRQKILNALPDDKKQQAMNYFKNKDKGKMNPFKKKDPFITVDDVLGKNAGNIPDSTAQVEQMYNQKQNAAGEGAKYKVLSKSKATDRQKTNPTKLKLGRDFSGSISGANTSNVSASQNQPQQSIIDEQRKDKKRDKISSLVDQYNKDAMKYKKNGPERWLNLAGTAAAAGMGVAIYGSGMAKNPESALAGAAMLNKPIDIAVTGGSRYYAEKSAYKSTHDPEYMHKSDESEAYKVIEAKIDKWQKQTSSTVNDVVNKKYQELSRKSSKKREANSVDSV